jgi:hypothetical protein
VFIILSERVGTVGAIYDVEAAKARGYDIQALVWAGFIGEDSPTKPPKTSKVTPKTDKKKD